MFVFYYLFRASSCLVSVEGTGAGAGVGGITFLDASTHLYNWLCPLVGWSVGMSVRPSIRPSVLKIYLHLLKGRAPDTADRPHTSTLAGGRPWSSAFFQMTY